ncbi:hypothetical protein HL667_05360 [Bradyrhizobium sp. 83012]|uniref:DUF6161 domain-containing protein n=1 Tax=Bradyrhizobium aeschynomenes TaxID=2734909 RepID=A0ABX2CB16_9BRAD|nr:DUF6161 domain-containing protein [Bradyrhizobium aeschynomenes]NPU64419.1 hypothetical protein [Bradyrhizobium aeschynomenes]
MTQIEPLLVIARPMRQMITLSSKSEAETFLDREEATWSWTDDDQPKHPSPQIGGLLEQYQPRNWIINFRTVLDRSEDEFRSLMSQRYENQQCLCFLDIEATAIAGLGQTDKFVAAVALAVIHGRTLTEDPRFLRDIRNRVGIAHGQAILAGIDPNIVSGLNSSLREHRQSIEHETQRLRSLIEEASETAAERARQIDTAALDLRANHDTLFSNAETKREEQYSRLADDLKATTHAFNVQMELQAPVSYWKKRATSYRIASRWMLAFLTAYVGVSVWILYVLYDQAASHLPSEAAQVPYSALFRASAFALLMTSIAFWIGRVSLRVFFSFRHLETDAEERRTMITTFLALTRRSAVSDEDRKFVLAALFRPGSDGIVSEDSAPDTMFAALLGSIMKR